MYYLTVVRNGAEVVTKEAFPDYAAAIASTSRFYKAKFAGSVLKFTTEVIAGQFARSYAALTRPTDVPDEPFDKRRYQIAAKQDVAFEFDASYLFVVESEFGVSEGDAARADEDDN